MSSSSAPVIAAVDLSPNSLPAARAAAWLARELEAPAVVVYAREPGDFGDWEDGGAIHGSFMSWAEAELSRVVSRSFDDAEITIVETANAPSEAICDEAARRGARLVVMGTHGRTALAHALYGSTATSVVRHAPCDVLTVRPSSPAAPQLDAKLRDWVLAQTEDAGIRRILCPVDFSEGSEAAFDAAIGLAGHLAASIDLVHVLPTPFWPVDEATRRELTKRSEEADRVLDRLVAVASARGVSGERHLVEGRAADEILLMAERLEPDLVVVGTHGRTGVKRWTIGSVAERLVRSSLVPVWTVRHAPV